MLGGMEEGDAGSMGVLVLRAWVERPQSVRVRITRVVGWSEQRSVASASIQDVCAVVTAWLEELLAASETPDPTAELPPR
jgi:hypothetical protein